MSFEEDFMEAAICIKHFDSILKEALEKSQALDIYLLREIYHLNFLGLNMTRNNFFERKDDYREDDNEPHNAA